MQHYIVLGNCIYVGGDDTYIPRAVGILQNIVILERAGTRT